MCSLVCSTEQALVKAICIYSAPLHGATARLATHKQNGVLRSPRDKSVLTITARKLTKSELRSCFVGTPWTPQYPLSGCGLGEMGTRHRGLWKGLQGKPLSQTQACGDGPGRVIGSYTVPLRQGTTNSDQGRCKLHNRGFLSDKLWAGACWVEAGPSLCQAENKGLCRSLLEGPREAVTPSHLIAGK